MTRNNDQGMWVPEKAPPSRLTEEYVKEEINSAKNGIGGLLIIGFSVARTIQIFSRVPGTAGVTHLATFFLGSGLQAFYLVGHQQQYGRVDATDFQWLLVAQFACWFVGFAALMVRGRKSPRIRPNEAGRGLLSRYLPFLSHDVAGVVSDTLVGAALIGILYAIGSPIQANTYIVILGLTLFCHACVLGQRFSYRQRVRYAQRRAAKWPERVSGRHYL